MTTLKWWQIIEYSINLKPSEAHQMKTYALNVNHLSIFGHWPVNYKTLEASTLKSNEITNIFWNVNELIKHVCSNDALQQ